MNTLVTSIGSISASFAIKTLKEMSFKVVGVDIYQKSWVATASEVDLFYQVPLTINSDLYLSEILSICSENNIKIVIPLTDVDVDFYAEHINIFKKHNLIVTISNSDVIDLVRNKLLVYQKLCTTNIKVIPTYTKDDYEGFCNKTPIVAKKVNGRSSQGLRIINNIEEFRKMDFAEDYIFQPLIKGDIIVVDVLSDIDKDIVVQVTRKELTRTSNGAGIAVEIIENNSLKDRVIELCKILNIKGCANFEFINTGDEFFLMDINPRPSAGVVFSNYAGYNFIKNHVNIFIEESIDDYEGAKEGLIITRKFIEVIN